MQVLYISANYSSTFGNAALNYIGGIAGINVGAKNQTVKSYSSGSNVVQYTAGTIQNCTTAQNKTVSGNSNVGAWPAGI